MLNILLATTRPEAMQPFTEALSSDPEVHLDQVASSVDVLAAVRASAPHLVIIDADLPDIAPLELVRKLLMANAMVNTAVISSLSEELFHEASEGLGVLSRVPVVPDRSDAVALLVKLRSILGVMG
ncbi:MAG TPA: response regulator [Syntrophobacteraceae bacterium]|nr:response regulator [Syntrophobacteraceae bacterium]